jgi:hypothetical protein
MSALLAVILLFALLSLVAAGMQLAAIVKLAPAHEQIGAFMPLGWWKFSQLERKAGPAAAQHLSIYKRAVIAFIVFLVLGVVLSGWTVNQEPSASTALLRAPQTQSFATLTDFRRVAAMPGAPQMES